MSNKDFGASVEAWATETQERLTAVRRRAVVLLGEEMIHTKPNGGRLPFETGNLAKSQQASTEAMPKIGEGPFTGSNVGLVAATLKVDQPVFIGYQAAYARRMNSGYVGADKLGRTYNQPGNHFAEGAIAKWQQLVTQAVADVKANAKPSKS